MYCITVFPAWRQILPGLTDHQMTFELLSLSGSTLYHQLYKQDQHYFQVKTRPRKGDQQHIGKVGCHSGLG